MENPGKPVSYVVFSMIFIVFEESGERNVMRIGVKVDKRGKERLREQKNEYNRVKETPERAPGTPEVRFMGGQGAPKIIGGMAALVLSGLRVCPKYLTS